MRDNQTRDWWKRLHVGDNQTRDWWSGVLQLVCFTMPWDASGILGLTPRGTRPRYASHLHTPLIFITPAHTSDLHHTCTHLWSSSHLHTPLIFIPPACSVKHRSVQVVMFSTLPLPCRMPLSRIPASSSPGGCTFVYGTCSML